MLTPHEQSVVRCVQGALRNKVEGQCYPASEAVYHLLGGKRAGYTPVRGNQHWWLRSRDGRIIDPTANQYPQGFDYSAGRGGGFLTKQPSKRAQKLLTKIHFAMKGKTCG